MVVRSIVQMYDIRCRAEANRNVSLRVLASPDKLPGI
jgi:hypothetical protein